MHNPLTSSIQQIPSWRGYISSASQEMFWIVWNSKNSFLCAHPPLVSIMSQINPVHSLPCISLRPILILLSHLCLNLPHGLFPAHYTTKPLYACRPLNKIISFKTHWITTYTHINTLCQKKKTYTCPCACQEGIWGNGSIVPLILNLALDCIICLLKTCQKTQKLHVTGYLCL